MPFQPATDIAECEVRMTLQGVPVENVFHFVTLGGGPWDAGSIEALAENLLSLWTTIILPQQSSVLSLRSVLAKDLSAPVAPFFEAFPLVPVNGSLIGAAVANQNAVVLTKRSGLTGRSARGRTYHVGITEDQMNGNFITEAYGDALNEGYELLRQEMADAGAVMVILSRFTGGVERPDGIAFNIVSMGLRNLRIDAQRRRMPSE